MLDLDRQLAEAVGHLGAERLDVALMGFRGGFLFN
jgi:hypothetical protein